MRCWLSSGAPLLACLLLIDLLPHVQAWAFVGRHNVRQWKSPRSIAAHANTYFMKSASSSSGSMDDAQLLRVSLPKPLGIQLEEVRAGFPGVRVAGVVEGGTAKEDGRIAASMVLVELLGEDVTGASFDSVMETLISAPASKQIDLVFRDLSVPIPPPPPPPPPPPVEACEVTVLSADGKAIAVVKATTGNNLRATLLAAKVDVYDMVGKMTNCNGGGQCGTCAVQVEEAAGWDERSDWETQKLKGRPEAQRLSCQTVIRGDATIITRPPKK